MWTGQSGLRWEQPVSRFLCRTKLKSEIWNLQFSPTVLVFFYSWSTQNSIFFSDKSWSKNSKICNVSKVAVERREQLSSCSGLMSRCRRNFSNLCGTEHSINNLQRTSFWTQGTWYQHGLDPRLHSRNVYQSIWPQIIFKLHKYDPVSPNKLPPFHLFSLNGCKTNHKRVLGPYPLASRLWTV